MKLFALALVLAACHSTTPGAGDASSSGTAPTGPLANLESAPFTNEVWIAQDGGTQLPILFYGQQNVRLSASCRNGGGQLACDALKQLRGGTPVVVPRHMVKGNVSAGTKACVVLKNTIVGAHDAQGNEDGFCRFPDGSLVSTGALEQYGMTLQ